MTRKNIRMLGLVARPMGKSETALYGIDEHGQVWMFWDVQMAWLKMPMDEVVVEPEPTINPSPEQP